jgi:hypothetical protein
MIRIVAKVFAVTVVLTVCLHVQPSSAGNSAYISATGTGMASDGCTATAPCPDFANALTSELPSGGRILCLGAVAVTQGVQFSLSNLTFDIDCPAGSWGAPSGIVLSYSGTNVTITVRNMAFDGVGGSTSALKITGSGTLILENCVLENFSSTALDIEPTGALNLVIKNSRISNNGSGVLIKPAAGGSVTATFDSVTLANNAGGGLKTDSADGMVTLDIYNSTVTNNSGVGINARSGGSLNMVSIKNSVITKNTAQGVQANGANVGVTVQTTLFDQNTSGATSVVVGGHISTYGNNSIIGSSGSGFTGTASLQ